jgi:hypothetical protein
VSENEIAFQTATSTMGTVRSQIETEIVITAKTCGAPARDGKIDVRQMHCVGHLLSRTKVSEA